MKKTLVKILTTFSCMLVLVSTLAVPIFAECDECEEHYLEGYNEGYDLGYSDGNIDGSELGYDRGFADGANTTEQVSLIDTLKDGVFAIFDAPARLIGSMLDFELFGINWFGFVKTVLTMVVFAAIATVLIKFIT